MYFYSIIIPVYNRPNEVEDLLSSLTKQVFKQFEVIIVEDGSSVPCRDVVSRYEKELAIRYFVIPNGGPSGARNYGAAQSKGDYLLILDSDCILPPTYTEVIDRYLTEDPLDAFGGPDRAHDSFTPIQKAISYSMTSFFTTGGIRGGKKKMDRFYPRSFNMGIKKEVYDALHGFDTTMRYGEDVDFSMRIVKAGYTTRLISDAYVYHKRRTSFSQFFRQVEHSGEARIVLSDKYPGSLKLVHCLPSLFVVGTIGCCLLGLFAPLFWGFLLLYIVLLGVDATFQNKGNIYIGLLSVVAAFTQLYGYGIGFIKRKIQEK